MVASIPRNYSALNIVVKICYIRSQMFESWHVFVEFISYLCIRNYSI